MRVTRLKASNVHGYLPINVEFLPDLTFLIGLNGSGKTTALRLLMGLLAPAIDELAHLEFTEAELEIEVDKVLVAISAVREAGSLTLRVTGIDKPLLLDASILEFFLEPKRREDSRTTPVLQMLQESPVFERIRSISTPMFLGLERRLYQEDRFGEPSLDLIRRRDMMIRHGFYNDVDPPTGVVRAGLIEVVMLVRDTMSEIRAKQEKLDQDLRQSLLLSAIRFKPSEFDKFEPPSKAAIDKYKASQEELKRAASLLQLPLTEVQQPLQEFFDKMSNLSNELAPSSQTNRVSQRKSRKAPTSDTVATTLLSWLINKSQVDRILDNLALFESYAQAKEALHEPINRLLDLLNKFLVQSNKCVEITDPDRLRVRLPDGRARSINALSSGERQLCVMLGHLALNPQLSGSGIFIVDEPELSLHLSWQEMFVSSVRAANTDVQLIFATHSPAIILDKEEHCRLLSGE